MILACCCGKSRKDETSLLDGTAGPESRIKNINRILLEFVNEESKIGLKEQPCIAMIEKVLLASNKGEIPKREIIQIYKSLTSEGVNQNSIKNFLIQDFFFVDNTRQKYDFNKVVLFNLLYSGGKDEEKANFLFNIVESTQSSAVYNHSQKLISTLENVTYISTIAVGEILNSSRRFTSEADDSDFQELLSLYSTNANMLREFSNHLSSLYLFPAGATLQDEKQYLNRQDFLKRVIDCQYLLIRPNEVRKKYTEYVWQNKARALLPSKLMLPRQRDSKRPDAQHSSQNQSRYKHNEESKLNSSGFSEQNSDSHHAQGRGTFNKHNNSSRKQSHAQNDYKDDRHQHRQEKLERFGGGLSHNNSYSQSNKKANPYLQHYPQQHSQFQQQSPNSRYPHQQSFNSSNDQRQLQRQNSDISQMAIYRYEDKSARGSNNSPASRQQKQNKDNSKQDASLYSQSSPFKDSSQKQSPRRDQLIESSASSMGQPQQRNHQKHQHSRQNSKGIQNYYATSRGNSPKLQSPKVQDTQIEKESQAKLYQGQQHLSSKQLSQGQLEKKMSSNRESSDTQASLHSTKNLQKYQNVASYLREMFGEQFVSLVAEIQEPFDEERQVQLQQKLTNIKDCQKLEFPDYSGYPYHVREVFEYFNAIIHKEDLLEFSKGRLFRENIINVYMKILEKISLIRQSQYNYQRATVRNSIDLYSQATNQTPLKILYFNTNFQRRLNNDQSRKDCLNQLQNFFKYDQVILPFFVDEENDQRALIVSVKVANFQVDLYDREREHDNNDISDTVLHIMEQSSFMQQIEFSEDMVDGGVEGVCVQREEDMLVAICYIAECITFNKPVELETFNLNIERQRVLDVFLSLLSFH